MIEEIQSIQEQLAALDTKRQALLDAYALKIESAKRDALTQISQIMADHGITSADLIDELNLEPRKTRSAKSAQKESRARCVYRDEAGREYKGGKPPAWLTEAMAAAGIATTREYCEARMSRVQ